MGDADSDKDWAGLPYEKYVWPQVKGANCENVIGYATIPIGVVSNIVINKSSYRVPMCTTEGALIASTQRGAKAIAVSGGAEGAITFRGMARAPVAKLSSAKRAAELKVVSLLGELPSADSHSGVAERA